MADPLSTALTHLTNLVSFKSSLRLLIIAGSIICCWVFIEPKLSPLKIPNELSLTLITIIGFSLGALISSILFGTFDLSKELINKKFDTIKKKAELQKKEEIKHANHIKKTDHLKGSFDDYSDYAKSILLKLKDNDCVIAMEDTTLHGHNKAFLGLLDGEIVLPLHQLDKTTTLCTINPLYKKCLNELFERKHRSEVEHLFNTNPNGFELLLEQFKDNTNSDDFIFNIASLCYENRYKYSPVINYNLSYEGDYIESCNIKFYITDHHYTYFAEKTDIPVRSYILGNYKKQKAST
ncbi:hypothetical protein RC77_01765 [Pectobacterium brasiliense]|uniref:hypothetical protein n=1 Tax=Pectobacterium brasiliense TaxID=180957 RepID=UPI00057E75D4|nr:hypothetical protein [Pectobacterium brasiliense]KHS71858.1 hypothetical protein RC77_01765 [Pectobacterium brasiliense]